MFEKILVAVDGSEDSESAIRLANKLIAQGLGKTIVMIHVEPEFAVGTTDVLWAAGKTEGRNIEEIREIGEKLLEEACAILEPGSAKVLKEFMVGNPSNVICEYAKENKCDLVIMGSRGASPLKGLLMGSVCQKVLHYAPCPVLITRAEW